MRLRNEDDADDGSDSNDGHDDVDSGEADHHGNPQGSTKVSSMPPPPTVSLRFPQGFLKVPPRSLSSCRLPTERLYLKASALLSGVSRISVRTILSPAKRSPVLLISLGPSSPSWLSLPSTCVEDSLESVCVDLS